MRKEAERTRSSIAKLDRMSTEGIKAEDRKKYGKSSPTMSQKEPVEKKMKKMKHR